MSQRVTLDISPASILDAFENYAGSFFDLDRGIALDGPALRSFRDRLVDALGRNGLSSGDRVVFCVGNGPAFLAGLAAVLTAGGSPLLMHPKSPPAELKRTALRLSARLAIVDDVSAPDWQTGAVAPLAAVPGFELFAARMDDTTAGFEAAVLALPGVPLHPTSGTTGVPKVAVRPARAAEAEARHYIETIGVTGDDAFLAAAPMCHAFAYGLCVMVPLFSGAHVVSMRAFQADLALEALASGRITIFPAVPAMLDVLLFDESQETWNSTRCVLTAGSPLPERTANRFREKTGIAVRPLYGTTETGGISVAAAEGTPLFGGQVGPAMRGVDAQIAADAVPNGAPPGVGRLLIRSSSMMAGYLGTGELATGDLGKGGIDESVVLADGWFDTGDLASIDSDRNIQLMGRESEVINVEGSKVIPCEVEEVIASFPGVREVKVYAGHRRNGGQFVKAAVVSDSQVEATSLLAHCERNLVYYKCPERIIPMDSLPRSPAGKILRDQLP
jgi:acyl-CoA synthetase (AMP-forming)/AMP-acid ligase II